MSLLRSRRDASAVVAVGHSITAAHRIVIPRAAPGPWHTLAQKIRAVTVTRRQLADFILVAGYPRDPAADVVRGALAIVILLRARLDAKTVVTVRLSITATNRIPDLRTRGGDLDAASGRVRNLTRARIVVTEKTRGTLETGYAATEVRQALAIVILSHARLDAKTVVTVRLSIAATNRVPDLRAGFRPIRPIRNAHACGVRNLALTPREITKFVGATTKPGDGPTHAVLKLLTGQLVGRGIVTAHLERWRDETLAEKSELEKNNAVVEMNLTVVVRVGGLFAGQVLRFAEQSVFEDIDGVGDVLVFVLIDVATFVGHLRVAEVACDEENQDSDKQVSACHCTDR